MKKYLISFILMVASISLASAEDPMTGIIVTYEGAETSYLIEEVPTVKYETTGIVRYAALYLKHQEESILRVALAKDKKLIVTYGEYTPTGIDDIATDKVTITERDGMKIIQGGKLIIIGKDGRKYNVAGVEIKD